MCGHIGIFAHDARAVGYARVGRSGLDCTEVLGCTKLVRCSASHVRVQPRSPLIHGLPKLGPETVAIVVQITAINLRNTQR